jgi:thiol-disulfide isomerase/thioredoxin
MKSAAIIALALAACAAPSPAPSPAPSTPQATSAPAAEAPAATPAPTAAADMAALGYHADGDPRTASARKAKCGGPADGSELVGQPLGEWQLGGWANTEGQSLTMAGLRGRVVVVRFWTVGCPHCEASMPALQKLSEELRDQPVTFVGAFHAKPESSEADLARPLEAIRDWKISFPLAIDREWRTLRSWWLERGHRHASSVTFVIGKDGRVVHVHPGPVYHPSSDPAEADANRDYLTLRDAILTAAKQ